MPEELLGKIKRKIDDTWKVCFASAIIFGLIAHFYKITNWLPNWDSLVFRYDAQNMVAMGRWFLPVACAPSSFYDLPWVCALLSILYTALGAVCICKIFNVRKNVTAALIGAVLTTFPTVTSVLMYNYVADGYALSFLLACLAAMFLTSKKPKYIVAIVCMALSVGIYQAYITVTIMLLLLHLIFELIYGEGSIWESLFKGGKFLISGVLGMALYYAVMLIILKVTGTKLLEYQGIDGAASLSGIDIPASLYTIKHSFTDYFFDFSSGACAFTVINCMILASSVIFYIVDMVKYRSGIVKTVLTVVLVAFLPIGASVLAFVNSSIDYHNLMKMGFVVFYLIFILAYEKTEYRTEKLSNLKAWIIFVLTAVLIFTQIIIANVSYHKLEIAYEKSYGVLIRIADRIEETEGADECSKILVLGALLGSEDYSANLPPDMTGTTDGYILRADDEIVGQSVLCSALNDYCGKNYTFVYGSEKKDITDKIDLCNLGVWPEANSVLVIDDVIVIRLGEEVG